ncbi:MAG: thioredoxin [Lachnospiraceae bacterium]
MAAIELTSANFEEEIKGAGIALVDFWAVWCGPCQMQGPVIEELAETRSDIKVCKVNVDQEAALAAKFQVMNIPSLVFFKNGEPVKKEVGFHSLEEIEDILKAL